MESLEARVDERVLDDIQARNEQKQMDFQDSLKTAVALGWVCEGYIDMVGISYSEDDGELTCDIGIDILHRNSQRVGGCAGKGTKACGRTCGQDESGYL